MGNNMPLSSSVGSYTSSFTVLPAMVGIEGSPIPHPYSQIAGGEMKKLSCEDTFAREESLLSLAPSIQSSMRGQLTFLRIVRQFENP